MPISYLGLGSNLGSPERLLRLAVKSISRLPGCYFLHCSPIYRSIPWGMRSQPDYWNMVLEINTRLTPRLLLKQCQNIEKQFGRVRKKRWGPRTLDIDILLYGHLIMKSAKLTIPHPHLLKRDFVLKPLLNIAPDLRLPNGEKISQFLPTCPLHIRES